MDIPEVEAVHAAVRVCWASRWDERKCIVISKLKRCNVHGNLGSQHWISVVILELYAESSLGFEHFLGELSLVHVSSFVGLLVSLEQYALVQSIFSIILRFSHFPSIRQFDPLQVNTDKNNDWQAP